MEIEGDPIQIVVSTTRVECPECEEIGWYRSNSVVVRCHRCGHQWSPFGIELDEKFKDE